MQFHAANGVVTLGVLIELVAGPRSLFSWLLRVNLNTRFSRDTSFDLKTLFILSGFLTADRLLVGLGLFVFKLCSFTLLMGVVTLGVLTELVAGPRSLFSWLLPVNLNTRFSWDTSFNLKTEFSSLFCESFLLDAV
jgi:hypothetical protein